MEKVHIGKTAYGSHWLARPAAEAWFRMVRDGCPTQGITDAGREQVEQEILFRKHFTTSYSQSAKFDPRQWAGLVWWRRPGYPSAATPGSPQARHQWGLSLDLHDATKAWVRANGHKYGWIKDVVSGEDWHMEYQSWRDTVLINDPGTPVKIPNLPDVDVTPVTPIDPNNPLGVDMSEARIHGSNTGIYYARIDSDGGAFIGLDATANLAADRMGIPITKHNASQRELQEIRQAVIDLSVKGRHDSV